MIFEKELISVTILDVLELDQKNITMYNTGRNFDALSFRIDSDAFMETDSQCHHVLSNSVCFVPARLNYKRIAKTDKLIVIHFQTLDYIGREIEVKIPEEPEKVYALFSDILREWNLKENGYLYRCTAILYEILAMCHAQKEEEKSRIQDSVNYLVENYRKSNITIAEIAERSFMSEVYFRKLFKAQYGISPQKYIIELRIQHAISLISTGYYSLKEVAAMSGYNDYKYFSVEFKKIKGVSPSMYQYNYEE